jgi:hypothetical protein
VVEAEQVEDAVSQVPVQLARHRPAVRLRATGRRIERDYHVTEERPNAGRIR